MENMCSQAHQQKNEAEFDASSIWDEEFQDANAEEPALREIPFTLRNLPRLILLAPIRLYQMAVSPALPQNTCRFYPTCSHYAYQAIWRHGALKGGLLAAWRVLRCNPFNPGGIDPIP